MSPTRSSNHRTLPLLALALLGCATPAMPPPPAPAVALPEAPAGEPLPPLAPEDVRPSGPGEGARERYGYLDDDDDPRTAKWVEAQHVFASAFLSRLPSRATIQAELDARPPEQTYLRLVETAHGTVAAWRSHHRLSVVILERGKSPREIPLPDTVNYLAGIDVAPTGTRAAVRVHDGTAFGARIVDLEAAKLLESLPNKPEHPVQWSHDGSAAYYQRGGADVAPSVLRHVVGEPVSADRTVLGSGTPSEKLVRGWMSDSLLQFRVGKRFVLAVVKRKQVERTLLPGGPAPIFSAAVVGLDGSGFREVPLPQKTGLAIADVDDAFLVHQWTSAHDLALVRVGALGGAATTIAARVPLAQRTFRAADAIYLETAHNEIVRCPPGGPNETIKLPQSALSVEASPDVNGLRMFLGVGPEAGWFALRGASPSRIERLALEPKQPDWAEAVQEDVVYLDAGRRAEFQVIHGRNVSKGAGYPALLLSSSSLNGHLETKSWLARGGVLVTCSLPPVSASASQETGGIGAHFEGCARAVRESGWGSRLGVLVSGADIANALVAVSRRSELFDALVLDRALVSMLGRRGGSTGAAALWNGRPNLANNGRPLPPVLVVAGPSARERHIGAKIVAQLNGENRDQPAALLRGSGEGGRSGGESDEADELAFLLWALTGEGANAQPRFVRR